MRACVLAHLLQRAGRIVLLSAFPATFLQDVLIMATRVHAILVLVRVARKHQQ